MKKLRQSVFILSACLLTSGFLCAEDSAAYTQTKPLKIAVVNFKTCVEKSKMGQKEQADFDAMKKQMESILSEKEKALTEVAGKFNDIDYLDSLSPDAEAELKRQFRTLNQEFSQQQNQFYQTLSQTNLSVIQKLNDEVSKTSKEVAKKNQLDLVLNDESCFFFIPSIDVSRMVIQLMDEIYDKESKESKPATAGLINPAS